MPEVLTSRFIYNFFQGSPGVNGPPGTNGTTGPPVSIATGMASVCVFVCVCVCVGGGGGGGWQHPPLFSHYSQPSTYPYKSLVLALFIIKVIFIPQYLDSDSIILLFWAHSSI